MHPMRNQPQPQSFPWEIWYLEWGGNITRSWRWVTILVGGKIQYIQLWHIGKNYSFRIWRPGSESRLCHTLMPQYRHYNIWGSWSVKWEVICYGRYGPKGYVERPMNELGTKGVKPSSFNLCRPHRSSREVVAAKNMPDWGLRPSGWWRPYISWDLIWSEEEETAPQND